MLSININAKWVPPGWYFLQWRQKEIVLMRPSIQIYHNFKTMSLTYLLTSTKLSLLLYIFAAVIMSAGQMTRGGGRSTFHIAYSWFWVQISESYIAAMKRKDSHKPSQILGGKNLIRIICCYNSYHFMLILSLFLCWWSFFMDGVFF